MNCARTRAYENTRRASGISPIKTVSRIYADVVQSRPKSYSDADSFVPFVKDHDVYSLITRIGNGKYSIVFDAIRDVTKEKVVIKVLKPVRTKKIKREIMVLQRLKEGPNIIKLIEVIAHPVMKITSLILERLEPWGQPFKNVYMDLSLDDIHYYSYEILKALDYCHSNGIMHRDIKPQNIIVDISTRQLRIIDWGLAEFYHPKQEYSVRVASRYYKSPELLISYGYYDYSLDMWSFGCMFASMVLQRDPLFHGSDNTDQLVKIVKILGSAEIFNYLRSYNIFLEPELLAQIERRPRISFEILINSENEHLIECHTLELIQKFLTVDHMKRISASEAMKHKYFDKLRQTVISEK